MKRQTVEDVMTRDVVTAAEETPFAEIADVKAEHRISAVPVLDEDGRLAGIVARRDLLRVFHRSDADIRDEIIGDVLVCRLWQDPAEVDVRDYDVTRPALKA